MDTACPKRLGWRVNCRAVTTAPTLTPNKLKLIEIDWTYVHRIAITNQRILATTNSTVIFRYQESKQGTWKTMTLPGREFLRRYLQHVLPQGFHKVRYYGHLSPANRGAIRGQADY